MKKKISKNTLVKYKSVIDQWFLSEFDSAKAYKKVYPKVKDSTAIVNFAKISKIPEVEDYIDEKREEALKYVEATHKGVLDELKRWIELDISETFLLDEEGIKNLPIELRRLITKHKITVNENYDRNGTLLAKTKTIELGFVSKERAMEMINKHIGFYEVDNKQKAQSVNVLVSSDKHGDLVNSILSGEFE